MSLAGRSGQKAQGGAAASVCHCLAPHTGQLQVGVGGGSALGMEPDHTDQAFAPACFSRGGSPRPEALVPTAAVPTGRLWSGKFPTQQLYLKQSIGERAVPRERWRSGASGGGWGRWSPRPSSEDSALSLPGLGFNPWLGRSHKPRGTAKKT